MQIPTIVWVLVIGLFVFYPIGLWEGRGRGYKKRKAEEEQEKKENPASPTNQPAKTVTVKVDDPGMMRIRNESGLLTLDLDGIRVNTAALTTDQRKRLIEMLNVIRPWLEGKPAPAPSPAPAPVVAPPPPSAQPRPAAASAPVPSVPRAAAPAGKEKEKDAPVATGIVGQIDTILQARLMGTSLEGRGIYLSNSPEGGVIVNVGLQKFNGIDEVTDPEIKAALRAAITEWENKYTPGL